jgi:hypothetical protein
MASREIRACSAGRAEPGGDQQRADLIAVPAGGVRLVVQAGPADMHGRGMIWQFLLDGVSVEPRYCAWPPGDGGPGPAAGLEVTGETLDAGAADAEQAQVMLVAPAGELAQVHSVRFTGQAAVTGQETG